MRFRECLHDDSGFSLVEVMLAVAILALVTLPIINYFTYSSMQTIDGRDRHMATMAAENVMEELRSYSNYEQIEQLEEKGLWTEVNTDDPDFTDMSKPVKVKINGSDYSYQAKAHIQYDDYNADTRTVSGEAIDAEYNDYEIPTPSEVYSSSNVVAAEDDQIDIALSSFFIDKHASVMKASIMNDIQRTMCIDVRYLDESKKDIYVVKLYHRYTYDTFTEEVVIEETNIEKDKLKSIFLFYNLLRDDISEENLEVKFGTGISDDEIRKMKIFIVCQKSETVHKPIDYKLMRVSTSSSTAELATYYTNVVGSDGNPSAGFDAERLVERARKKRIGSVTVDIYEEDDTSFTEPVAHLESTMAE